MDRREFLRLAALGELAVIPQALSRDAQLADILRRIRDLEASPDLYGATITGSIFQTDTDEVGFKIKTDGIRQYDSAGAVTASWTDDGIDLADASITGGIMTGGLLRTDSDGSRIEISAGGAGWTSGEISFYYQDAADPAAKIRYLSPQLQLSSSDDSTTSHVDIFPDEVGLFNGTTAWWDSTGGDVQTRGETYVMSSGDYIQISADSYVQLLADTYVEINADGDVNVFSGGDVKINAGTGASSSVYLLNIPSVTGKTANVYMDPSTGKISRI